MNKAVELKQKDYTIQLKYSPEAVEKKLMKFISKSGDEFVISADEMISFLVEQVNLDVLSPAFVETDKVNVVEVSRQLKCVLDKDMKKGTVIQLNYIHPYPIEFALIEQAWKIAKIEDKGEVRTLTKEFIDNVRSRSTPNMEKYLSKYYKSFKELKFNK